MEDEDRKPAETTAIVLGANLDDLSVHELEERIAACEAEIARLKAAAAAKRQSQEAADSVFKI